jgi:hypothetical protein
MWPVSEREADFSECSGFVWIFEVVVILFNLGSCLSKKVMWV